MSSKGGSAPKAPDPTATANAQGNVDASTARLNAQLNRVNQLGPDGSVTYSNNGDNWTQTTNLSPAQQQILNLSNGVNANALNIGGQQIQRVGDALSTPFNYDGIPYAPNTYDFSVDRDKVTNDMYNRGSTLLNQQFDRQQGQLDQNLADRGIGLGNAGYTQAQTDFGNTRDQAYQGLASDSLQAGGAEQSRLYGLAQNARQQAIQERAYQQNLPLQQLSAILGTSSGVQSPQFSSVPQTQSATPDYQSAAYNTYQGQLANYQAQQQQQNALWGGLSSLGSAAASAYFR